MRRFIDNEKSSCHTRVETARAQIAHVRAHNVAAGIFEIGFSLYPDTPNVVIIKYYQKHVCLCEKRLAIGKAARQRRHTRRVLSL